MKVTVSDVLALDIMSEARLLAGRAGLGREVEFIDILESPGGIRMLKPNDVLVTTVYPVLNDEQGQRQLIQDISDIGVSLLCIKTGRYIERVPDFMISLANEANLPLVELPPTVVYADIIYAVSALIIGSQAATLRRSLDINTMFTSILQEGGALDELTHALAETIHCPVIVEDTKKKILSYAYYPIEGFPSEGYWLAVYRALKDKRPTAKIGNVMLFASQTDPVCRYALSRATYRSEELGCVLAAYADEFTEIDGIALENAASFISLALATEKSTREKELTIKLGILNDLLHGNTPTRSDYPFWFKQLHIDPYCPYLVFIVYAHPVHPANGNTDETESSAFDILLQIIHKQLPKALLQRENSKIAVLMPVAPDMEPVLAHPDRQQVFFGELLRDLKKRVGQLPLRVAAGEIVEDIHHVSLSYNQALTALEMGKKLHRGDVSLFTLVQLYDILAKYPDKQELQGFGQSLLAPLFCTPRLRFDAIGTLEAYLRTGASLERTAAALYVHVSTVKYRIGRIKEALQNDLDDAQYLLHLNIAVMIYRLFLAEE